MKSLQGHFLVAAPQLEDPNFHRTVVYMLQHDEQGAMGLVLNRPSGKTVREVWLQVTESECSCNEPVYIGGPVAGPLMAMHQSPHLSDATLSPGVYLSTRKEYLDELANGNQLFRLYSGYAGWGADQLESELEMGGWLTWEATPELIFSEPDELWPMVTQQVSLEYMRRWFPDGQLPQDPSLN